MAARQRQLREAINTSLHDHPLLTEGWSNWQKALVPLQKGREHRGNPKQVGLMFSDIKTAFPENADCCGIYEWKAVKTGQRERVIYVGSTCRRKRGSLRYRILEYCSNGSHKSVLINDALKGGYELHVRVKISEGCNSCYRKECKKDAEDKENELLAKYDYAWNKRRNGSKRTGILNGN